MRDNSASYFLTTPAGTILLDMAERMFIESIETQGEFRGDVTPRAQTHGSWIDNAKRGGLTTILTIRAYGTGYDLELKRSTLQRCLMSLYGEDGTGTLTWTHQGAAEQLQLSGLYLADEPAWSIDGTTLLCMAALTTERPYAESANENIVDSGALASGGSGWTIPLTIPLTLVASSGGIATVTNSGDWNHATPTLQVYGPITNPNVVNVDKQERLVFSGSIGSGDYWEIDLDRRTVKLNGTGASQLGNIDSDQSIWFTVSTGETDLQLTGSGFDSATKLRVLMRSAYG